MPAASTLVRPACSSRPKGFASTATLEKDGKSCDMRKLMALMGMGVKQGETVTVKVEGDDEEAAAAAIQKFLTENV